MSQSSNRISLNKRYMQHGFADKVFHLHIGIVEDNIELYFRNYLNENIDVAKKYKNLNQVFGENLNTTKMNIPVQREILLKIY